MTLLAFVTHPQVQIDPLVPVPEWGLSDLGRTRVLAMLAGPWISKIARVVSSGERKALETAEMICAHTGIALEVRAELGENDRSSTGFVPPDRFEAMADRFFANPSESVEGWETARDAQRRIVEATADLIASPGVGITVVVSHGAVGTLLYCHLIGLPINRTHDQPGQGHTMWIARPSGVVLQAWHRMESDAFSGQF